MPMVFLSSGTLFQVVGTSFKEVAQNGHLHDETHIYTPLLPTYRIKTFIVHSIDEIQLTCLAVFVGRHIFLYKWPKLIQCIREGETTFILETN